MGLLGAQVAQQVQGLLQIEGAGEYPALNHRAARALHPQQVGDGFHTLGHHFQVEGLGHGEGGAGDGGFEAVGAHARGNGAVDLDLRHRQAGEIAEVGIAHAEVVERELHAHLAELLEHREQVGVVLDFHVFGEFEYQLVAWHVETGRHVEDAGHAGVHMQLSRRHVVGHGACEALFLAQAREALQGDGHHHRAEAVEQAAVGQDGDELVGLHALAVAARPTRQSLDPSDLVGAAQDLQRGGVVVQQHVLLA